MGKQGVAALFAALLVSIVAGCGQTSAPSPSAGALQPLTSAGTFDSSGGVISLTSGASAKLQPNVVPSAQTVTLLHDPSLLAAAPNPAWKSEPGILAVSFSSPIPDGLITPPPGGATVGSNVVP
jgi:hypothetical protein